MRQFKPLSSNDFKIMSKDLECIKGWPLTYSPPFVSKKWQAKAREPILDLLMSKGTIIQHKKRGLTMSVENDLVVITKR